MAQSDSGELQDVVRSAVAADGIESAAIFVVTPGSPDLQFAAAAGVEGVALERLIAAVRDPAHPISRAITDDGPTFDVRPMNPGGPALRSHLPLVAMHDGRRAVVGVLAVAHDAPLTIGLRQSLERLAVSAAASIDQAQVAG